MPAARKRTLTCSNVLKSHGCKVSKARLLYRIANKKGSRYMLPRTHFGCTIFERGTPKGALVVPRPLGAIGFCFDAGISTASRLAVACGVTFAIPGRVTVARPCAVRLVARNSVRTAHARCIAARNRHGISGITVYLERIYLVVSRAIARRMQRARAGRSCIRCSRCGAARGSRCGAT